MKNRNIVQISLVTALAFAFAYLPLPVAAQSPKGTIEINAATAPRTVSQTATAGPYVVTLKVLPAETFQGAHPEMARDGGAQPNAVNGPEHPNHHLVAFIQKNGVRVTQANVKISYRADNGKWTTLPIVRMHVAGDGMDTTHFGNNIDLPAKHYNVRVTVDGDGPATFHVSL